MRILFEVLLLSIVIGAVVVFSKAVTSQGGKDYVQLKAIEKWDGHLPMQMVPGSTVPFIDLTKSKN
jgi:prohibitin 2